MTSIGRVLGGMLALIGTALYALPPAIVATGYLEHRDADRRAKMAAFEKLFENKRLLVLRHASKRLRSRVRQATIALRAAVRLADLGNSHGVASAIGTAPGGDATDAELLAAMQQAGSGDLALTLGRGTGGPSMRSAMIAAAAAGAQGSHRLLPGLESQPSRAMRRPSSGSFRLPPRVLQAAKSLLLACKGDLSSGVRALTEAERWAATADAAADDTSLPDLVRLQTRGREF
jgi:hypothetical protein